MASWLLNGGIFCANFARAARGSTLSGAGAPVRHRTRCLRSFGEVSSPGNASSLQHATIAGGVRESGPPVRRILIYACGAVAVIVAVWCLKPHAAGIRALNASVRLKELSQCRRAKVGTTCLDQSDISRLDLVPISLISRYLGPPDSCWGIDETGNVHLSPAAEGRCASGKELVWSRLSRPLPGTVDGSVSLACSVDPSERCRARLIRGR